MGCVRADAAAPHAQVIWRRLEQDAQAAAKHWRKVLKTLQVCARATGC